MPHYPKPGPRILDKQTAVSLLPPLVWPMVNDKAKISTPISGNNVVAGVDIFYAGKHVTLTPEQYEKLRIEVLIPIHDEFYQKNFPLSGVPFDVIEKRAKQLVEEAFADE